MARFHHWEGTTLALATFALLAACGEPGGAPPATNSAAPTAGATATRTIAAGVAPGQESSPTPPAAASPGTTTTGPTATRATTTGATMSGDWRTYRNQQAGYAVDYPAAWAVNERADPDGALVTAFTPASNGAGISVTVRPGPPPDPAPSDIPNVRCQPLTVGGLAGARCSDTIALSTVTTLAGPNRTYIIATIGRRADQPIYGRLVASFRPLP